jgi:hypothetical protein
VIGSLLIFTLCLPFAFNVVLAPSGVDESPCNSESAWERGTLRLSFIHLFHWVRAP